MAIFKRAASLSQDEYQDAIDRGLGRAFEEAERADVQLADLRIVVFSDLHRGARDGADDFQRCEPAYSAALGWYLERGYQLWLLGDVDELWENDIDEVLPSYEEAMKLEKAFLEGPGLRRFFGNHDLDWNDPKRVDEQLGPHLPGVKVGEALRLRVLDGDSTLGMLFLAHGHQGTDASDRFAWFSRWVLRNIWRRVQASQGWSATTPASSWSLRAKHDTAMYHWARAQVASGAPDERPVLIAGHTHHPVFPDKPPPREDDAMAKRLAEELERARQAGEPPDKLAERRGELERVRAVGRGEHYDPPDIEPPCYFNTGCCCFPDRDVTGLELSDGTIRLVRWLDDEGHAKPKPLATLPLRDMFERIAAA
jgi:UDP-2,3-diacylglucosamine pyrophosphatase LpxH